MKFGNTAVERAALERTYEDTATVLRAQDEPVGAIDKPTLRAVHENVICALSRDRDRSKQTAAQQDVDYDAIVFVSPECDIQPGDMVEVTRFGEASRFEAVGRAAVYATHREVFLKERTLG